MAILLFPEKARFVIILYRLQLAILLFDSVDSEVSMLLPVTALDVTGKHHGKTLLAMAKCKPWFN